MKQPHTQSLSINGQTIAFDIRGDGPPVLLLHGFPQTRAMWGPIAEDLARDFTVVCADLRGYGESSKPADMAAMSFRNMGADMNALMQHIGFSTFHLVGHDRGARTAHRMALDFRDSVQSLTVMDIVPTHHMLATLTTEIARAYYHWFFLAQPASFPETMIAHDPDSYFERCLLGFGKAQLSDFDPARLAAYRKAWRHPESIRAMCNDYRAAIDVDFADDAADLKRRVACPALVLFGQDGAMAQAMDVAATWTDRLADMRHAAIPGGHFFPDQSPTETAAALRSFLSSI
ncbi:alpha/beta fold hydrolase [Puniceibacterium sediminis]|uniref:Haloacetate dehalogenase n=1 Tax=Puniceibacterium sediminis TaxID=1608407 RepID=A0A238W9M0_9RHOB|nr:alpha/beta hydrolase [Puniceibacterium sediminis]SNR42913.1 haloacetate dehalogenase [Puniceibacterium sediminis]